MAATVSPEAPAAEPTSSSGRPRLRVLGLGGSRRPVSAGPDPEPGKPGASRDRRPVTTVTVVAGGILLVAALLLAFVGYLLVGSGLAAHRAQSVLYQQLRSDLGAATVPVSGSIPAGTPLGVVRADAIGLDQVFVEGSSSEQTMKGPGLKTDTVLPGQAGLSVLVGRRATFGAAFAHIGDLQPGDRIDVTTGQGHFTYVVDLVRTSDAPASRMRIVPARLTLVTSDPAFTPNRSLMVSARLRGTPQPATTGSTAPASDQPGQGSHDRAIALLLWCELLLATSVLVTWAALRHPGRAVWIGAAPVLLAILWNVFENLAVLLPNTL